MTKIYTTTKLEKVFGQFQKDINPDESSYFGNWKATIFTANRKKCWLNIHKPTKYVVVLPYLKKSDMKNIDVIFKEGLHQQLARDGIQFPYELIEKFVGKVILYKTENDRSINSSLNDVLYTFKDLKQRFGEFDEELLWHLCHKTNNMPCGMLDYSTPKNAMVEFIKKVF